MTDRWYARPVVAVSDMTKALGFYGDKLGFHVDWRHEEADETLVAQVSRSGCELILSSQWPERAGTSVVFVSLDEEALIAARQEIEAKGVRVADGHWGYRLAVVEDPDGNALWFPYPADSET
jgi:catechol 2,3-dioxygenase-like lactoylglutathione lyase family enzyme